MTHVSLLFLVRPSKVYFKLRQCTFRTQREQFVFSAVHRRFKMSFVFLSRYQQHIFYHQWNDTKGSKVLDTDLASQSRTYSLRKVQSLERSGHLKLDWMYNSAISQYLTEEMYEAACGNEPLTLDS